MWLVKLQQPHGDVGPLYQLQWANCGFNPAITLLTTYIHGSPKSMHLSRANCMSVNVLRHSTALPRLHQQHDSVCRYFCLSSRSDLPRSQFTSYQELARNLGSMSFQFQDPHITSQCPQHCVKLFKRLIKIYF